MELSALIKMDELFPVDIDNSFLLSKARKNFFWLIYTSILQAKQESKRKVILQSNGTVLKK